MASLSFDINAQALLRAISPNNPILILGPMNTNKTTFLKTVANYLHAEINTATPQQRISTILANRPIEIIDEAQFLVIDAFYMNPQTIYIFAGLELDYKGQKWPATEMFLFASYQLFI